MELRKELADFLAEIRGETHPGESLWDRGEHIVLEFIDVAGAIIGSLDLPNQSADLEKLIAELIETANLAVDKFLSGQPYLAMMVKAAVTSGLPLALQSLAVKHGGNVNSLRLDVLLPLFTRIEQLGRHGRIAFGE